MQAIDRERLGAGALPIWVHHEHKARWRFASAYVKDKVVADCACGVGLGSTMFAKAGAKRVLAFDLSSEAVEAARVNCANLSQVSVRQADGCNLPLEDGCIDLFVSFESIEHIDDDRGFLKEVTRVLAPRGYFICSTPNRTITMPGKTIVDAPWNPFHVREYAQAEFLNLLREYFCDIQMFGQNPQSSWRIGLLERIGKRLPGHLGGRINSALKLPRLAYDNESRHAVAATRANQQCEYLVAICSTKRNRECSTESKA